MSTIGAPTDRDNELLNELLNAVDAGFINEETIGMFRYEHLRALLRYAVLLGEGENFYLKIKQYLENISINRLKKKEKIKVGFVVSGIPVWCEDELYRLLDESNIFEPYVYVFLHNIGQTEKMIVDEYDEHVKFFREKGMRVVETMNRATGIIYPLGQIGELPDICIWTTPWIYAHASIQCFTEYPLSTIHTYIPYGYMLTENADGNYVQFQYNYEFHNLVWKIFEESALAVTMAEKYAFVGKSNAEYAGTIKMDSFYELSQDDPWEELVEKCGNKDAKRIIYAPHHSVHEGTVLWATFEYNHRELLQMAKKYAEDTVWLVKPHPAMKFRCIAAGIFKNEAEWDAYIGEWMSLKNVLIYEGTEYQSFFKYSDAMILDSISFIAEYLYSNKPQLFLEREEQHFNETGELLSEALYKVDGKDIKGIESFLEDVVIGHSDVNKVKREEIFEKYLAYRNFFGKDQSAAQNVYQMLIGIFIGK